jgi:hypothetical protein
MTSTPASDAAIDDAAVRAFTGHYGARATKLPPLAIVTPPITRRARSARSSSTARLCLRAGGRGRRGVRWRGRRHDKGGGRATWRAGDVPVQRGQRALGSAAGWPARAVPHTRHDGCRRPVQPGRDRACSSRSWREADSAYRIAARPAARRPGPSAAAGYGFRHPHATGQRIRPRSGCGAMQAEITSLLLERPHQAAELLIGVITTAPGRRAPSHGSQAAGRQGKRATTSSTACASSA